MKQQGKTWKNAQGEQTLAKYLPAHERLFEKLGQKIAAEALDIERRLREAKAMFVDLCEEALRNNPDKNISRRFTFHTFDREFKIEFDVKEKYVRVYKSTKHNPTSKDYELINLDFNKAVITPTQEDFDRAIETLQDPAPGEMAFIPLTGAVPSEEPAIPAEQKSEFDDMAGIAIPGE